MRCTNLLLSSCVAIIAFGLSSSALAATYQVGPGQTYPDLQSVAGMLAPGDLVLVQGDTTYAGDVIFDQPGTAQAPITIRGTRVNGNRPVFSGGFNTMEARANHYVIESVDLTGGSSRCFYHHADDITLRDAVVHDCPSQGILGGDTDTGSLLLEYTEVHHAGNGTGQHQIYMATDETTYPGSVFRMQHCYVHDGNGGNNLKSRAERNEIYSNWIEGALYHEIELIGADGQDESLAREDSDVVGNVLLKRNTFYVARFGGDGTGETNGRYRFVNNTVIVLPGGDAVFRLFDGLQSVEMHNNAFVTDQGGTVNLVRDAEAVWESGTPIIAGSNNWVSAGAMNVPAAWTGTLTGDDAGFSDEAGLDMQPLDNSPLVDAGDPSPQGPPGYPFPSPLDAPKWKPPFHTAEANGAAQPRPVVGVIDIGAFEFGTGSAGGDPGPGTGQGDGTPGSGSGMTDGDHGGSHDGDDSGDSGDSGGAQGCSVSGAGRSGSGLELALVLSVLGLAGARRRRG